MILVRHPEVVTPGAIVGQRNVALSARGIAQIDDIVAALPAASRVVSSDLSRCLAIARRFPRFDVDPRWREQSFGEWEGRTWEEVDGRDYLEHWTTGTPPGGESIVAVRDRVAGALRELGDDCIVITHAGPIRCALSLLRGLSLQQAFDIRVDYGAIFNWSRT